MIKNRKEIYMSKEENKNIEETENKEIKKEEKKQIKRKAIKFNR